MSKSENDKAIEARTLLFAPTVEMLYLLWTKAVGTKDYDKKEWQKLELSLYDLVPLASVTKPVAEPEEWADRPTPEDEAIGAAFPTRSGSHAQYQEAMRLVGARHSKGALVAMTNWLLLRLDKAIEAREEANTRLNNLLDLRLKDEETELRDIASSIQPNVMDAPGHPRCVCGNLSATECGDCLICAARAVVAHNAGSRKSELRDSLDNDLANDVFKSGWEDAIDTVYRVLNERFGRSNK